MQAFRGIPGSERWLRVEKIDKGWSNDEKYKIVCETGEIYALRLSGADKAEDKRTEFERLQRLSGLSFPVSRALEFGTTADGAQVYQLLTWVEGDPLEERLDAFSPDAQYALGWEAGEALRQIHDLDPAARQAGWEQRMTDKILARTRAYETCEHRVEGDGIAMAYVQEQAGLLQDVRQVMQHGDYHIGNLLLTPEGRVGVIDFNRSDIGDYVEEFYKVQAFDRERSIPFARGKIDGYFGSAPIPEEFWRRLSLYVAYTSLFSIVWAIPFGQADVEGMQERCRMALDDYEGFRRFIPKWYEGKG